MKLVVFREGKNVTNFGLSLSHYDYFHSFWINPYRKRMFEKVFFLCYTGVAVLKVPLLAKMKPTLVAALPPKGLWMDCPLH
jgi:hypothetical protein